MIEIDILVFAIIDKSGFAELTSRYFKESTCGER